MSSLRLEREPVRLASDFFGKPDQLSTKVVGVHVGDHEIIFLAPSMCVFSSHLFLGSGFTFWYELDGSAGVL